MTFAKVIQCLSHPSLIGLYLGSSKRQRDSLRDYNEGKCKLSHLPRIVRIEPTNKCNLRCIMCPTGQRSGDRHTGFMDMGLYEKIVDEVGTFPYPTWLMLYLGGEPLLHKDLVKMIRMAKDRGLYCRFDTNATLLTADVAEGLLESGLDSIVFSFDDVLSSEYEAIRRNAKYEKTLANIINFLRLKKKYGTAFPFVTIASVKLRTNDGNQGLEISKRFRQLFSGYAVQNFVNILGDLWAGDFADNKLYQYKRGNGYVKPCKMLWNSLAINWQGDVVACCLDLNYDCILGNVRDSSLANVWNNEKMVGMRQLLHSGKYGEIKLCSTCSAVKGEVVTKVEA